MSNLDNENLIPQEAETPQDDDLLNWTPPELTQRALYTAQKDAGNYRGKKKKVDLSKPPAGKHRTLSLALLLSGAALLVLGTILAATGANGQQAVLEKGRLWYALWMSGQASTLCIFLLFLLPLDRDMRRPALFTVLGAGLAFFVPATIVTMLRQDGDMQAGALATGIIFIVLVSLACSPSLWLLLGMARRRSGEKAAAVAGCVMVFLNLMGLFGTLSGGANASPPAYVLALEILQGGCYVALLFNWPVLERPVLSNPQEGGMNDGQPE